MTRNHLLRNHYPENGVIIRRAELELRTAGTGGDFCPAQTLRADKTLFSRVAGMPNQKEFGQTAGLAQRQPGIFAEDLDLIEQDFGKLAAKLPRMQLIVDLLPGGNGQGVLIHIGCVSLMNIVNFNLRRQPGVFRQRLATEMVQICRTTLFIIVKAGGKPLPAPPTGYGFLRR